MCLTRAYFDEAAEGGLIRIKQHFDGHILDAAPQALVHLHRQESKNLATLRSEGHEQSARGVRPAHGLNTAKQI